MIIGIIRNPLYSHRKAESKLRVQGLVLEAVIKGNYRWGVQGIQGFYEASIRYVDLEKRLL